MLRLGIDLGGTKISAVVLDEAGAVRYRARRPTPQGLYRETLETVGQMVEAAEATVGSVVSIGIGTPGSIGLDTGLLRNANSVCLNGKPFQADLEHVLGRKVQIENDANCFALSEAADGAGAGARVVFGVILGTGTGGGVVVDGRLVTGANRIAGEWGHNPLPAPDARDLPLPECYCGRFGCIETFLSGPGLSEDYRRQTGVLCAADDIARRARERESAAGHALERYTARLARALAGVINLLDPDVIVLGGGLSNVESLYEDVPKEWPAWVFSDSLRTCLSRNKHGDDSGVLGAARLTASTPTDRAASP